MSKPVEIVLYVRCPDLGCREKYKTEHSLTRDLISDHKALGAYLERHVLLSEGIVSTCPLCKKRSENGNAQT